MPRHFITGTELSADELHALIERALELKAAPYSSDVLRKRAVALLFQKPSTRTRVSFEAGIAELGGHPMVLRTDELQLSRGEPVRDTAYVLSRHAAAIGIRTGDEDLVSEMAEHATVPVINMLTPGHHPCQALADLLTLREAFGRLEGLTLAYVGDGNNVARSLVDVGALGGRERPRRLSAGYQLEPGPDGLLTDDPREAVAGADAVYTDVWVSMSDDPDVRRRAPARASRPTGSTTSCSTARPRTRSRFTACRPTPARRSPSRCSTGTRQRIWDQAENRRHAQKALLELLIDADRRGVRVRSRRAFREGEMQTMPSPKSPSGALARAADRGPRASAASPSRRRRSGQPGRAAGQPDHQAARAGGAHPRPDPGGPRRRRRPRPGHPHRRQRAGRASSSTAAASRPTSSCRTSSGCSAAAASRSARRRIRARRSESLDLLLRSADRARRTVGTGQSFPILGYDELTAAQVQGRLDGLSPAELRKVRDYERRHANRKSVLAAIDKHLTSD